MKETHHEIDLLGWMPKEWKKKYTREMNNKETREGIKEILGFTPIGDIINDENKSKNLKRRRNTKSNIREF